jgi:osmotically-inducible protein OsmY
VQTIMKKVSDRELRAAISRQLDWAGESDIKVSVKEGAVTLKGLAQFLTVKVAVEEVAKSVYGVKSGANEIRTEPPARREHYSAVADVPTEHIVTRTLTGIQTR